MGYPNWVAEKGLPNTRTKIDVHSEEEIAQEVAVQEPEEQKGPIEVIPEEDGGVTLDFDLLHNCQERPKHWP